MKRWRKWDEKRMKDKNKTKAEKWKGWEEKMW
jgi:hypothetical protein